MPPARIFLFAFAASLSALGGCGGSNLPALKRWVANVEARPAAPIPPPPAPQRPRAFVWKEQDLRSPFLPPDVSDARPARAPAKTYLEQFPLAALRLVGELGAGGRTWALILDPQGRVSRVGIGDRLGREGGRIVAITPAGVEIGGAVPDGAGVPTEQVLAFAHPEGAGRHASDP